ncbi:MULTISPECIES: tRNA glutamyl-Q(34) synthetase GluQRS [unclassified Ruegeria]|uniref:tRNA glutamyl-Q(34) synthetase GluQRS n=1 Tax=unclassified Ruegeria TaxID=2625375 RepID=UPI001492E19B|nr:tRNA glutamyl-Q(34) synthetase GluQRS [Ruegeria sp. HKCCD5849]NOD50412.1 tRNA glutamyl-Q(34) synthetase GluQRS [Ruegeria sp. HKCCD5851]NOD67228.1 tRNA glutamyl-Q(34) synthetase GluQRS [Ruegeria sp. HKCCD7303]
MTFLTRFAPSPTGPLHLGHAYSALMANDMAKAESGQFLLRIEDIDQSRSRRHWEDQIYDDLTWLGLNWPRPLMRQSDRMAVYDAALDQLWARGFLYPCTCNRKDIAAAASAPQEGAPLHGPDGIIYPGTCRKFNASKDLTQHLRPKHEAVRLDISKACQAIQERSRLQFTELGSGPDGETGVITFTPDEMETTVGDVVLSRRDMGTSYHLSVVLDDAAQGITRVVRGRDLFEATRIHVLLQVLLDLPTPEYFHHDLIRDDAGKRLAKRDDARAIAKYRAEGASPADIRRMVGL